MRPKERRETGQSHLFRARLDQIVDPTHPLVRLAGSIDWGFLEARCGAVYDDDPGRPPLRTRSMAGLAISSTCITSPTRSCARAGSRTRISSSSAARSLPAPTAVRPLVADALAPAHGRGQARGALQDSFSVATRTGAAKPSDFTEVIIDTTVQEKAIAFPTDAKLLHRAREHRCGWRRDMG